MYRDNTKVIHIGNKVIGGGSPIMIQSMTNTKTDDVEATVAQIKRLEEAGCDIIRCTVPNIEAAKAIAFKEARTPEYQAWAAQVVKNAQALAEGCKAHGMPLQTGGTDNHLMLCDVTGYGLTGKQAEAALFACGVTANANALPYDKNGAWWTSGIRIGTPGLTTLGMNEQDMKEVADIIDFVLKGTKPGLTKEGKPAKGKIDLDSKVQEQAKARVNKLLSAHVLYPELDLDFLKKEFVKA